jgi:hypothetical protein
MTDGGLGVAFFAPFHNERYFFPWRPIAVSPIGMGFFSERGLEVIISELHWGSLLLAVALAYTLLSAGSIPRATTGMVTLLLFALVTFLYGVHLVGWSLSFATN